MRKIVLIIISLLINTSLFSNEVRFYKPSFNCENVRKNTTEWVICTNKTLSAWDRYLSKVYEFALKKENYKKKLKQTQIKWIRQRNKCKTDKWCIEESYTARIQILIDTYVTQQTFPDEYIFELVKKYPIEDCSKIRREKEIVREAIAGDRTSAVVTVLFDKNATNEAIKECQFIKNEIWNEKVFKNITIIKPTIKAKFFKDKRYQEFLKKAIQKAPDLKVDLKYGSYVSYQGTGSFYYPDVNQEMRDYLEKDQLFKARDVALFNKVNLNICDIRVYEAELDGNVSDGKETLVFSGKVVDPRTDFSPSYGYMKIFNFQEKKVLFTPYYEPKRYGKLRNWLPTTTFTCLDYKNSFQQIPAKNFFLLYKSSYENHIVLITQSDKYNVLVIHYYDKNRNKIIKVITNLKGEAR